jgi:predicted Zn-dependent protease with MMP-like domain
MDHKIIMNFSVPPSADDLEAIARDTLSNLPEEILELCETLTLQIEDFPDETVEAEMELDDPYELLAIYRSGKQIAPGVQRKVANDDDVLILYRRPILDVWCETGEDLSHVVREVMIEELGNNFEFTEDEIEEMAGRHYQGRL